jgi:hypothetical protein
MKTITTSFFILLFSFFIFQVSKGQVIHVPADFPTIQLGIAAANPGDTVLVSDGLYYENIDFLGKKPLMVTSYFLLDGDTNHINSTIINGSQSLNPDFGSTVYFMSGEDTTSVLYGFTVTGGSGTFIAGFFRGGAGVCILTSGAKLLNNHIEFNEMNETVRTNGGGVSAVGPVDPLPWIVMRHNRINHNRSISYGDEGDGGGFDIWYNLIMENNELCYNEANGSWRGDGGGGRVIAGFGPVQVIIRNNIVTYNKAISVSDGTDLVLSGGLDFWGDCSGVVSGNIISYNFSQVPVAPVGKTCYGTGVLVELDGVKDPDFLFENNMVISNTFTGEYCYGGGICVFTSGGKFQNNIIKNNEGTNGGGIAVMYNTDTNQVILINNTLAGNTGTWGGGMYIESGNAVVINSIFWGNEAPNSPSIYNNLESALEVIYSDVEGENVWPGEGNILKNPGFQDDSCHIFENSECEDAGTFAIYIGQTLYEIPEYDFEGDVRPFHLGIDMGADECDTITDGVSQPSVIGRQSSVSCYPNPTSGIVDFRLSIVDFRRVSLKVYNAQGLEVAVILDEEMAAGKHTVRWDAANLPAGVYYYRLTTKDQRLKTEAGKILKF